MSFVLSNIFGYIILPLTWIILLIIGGYISKSPRKKKIFFLTAIAIFLLFGNSALLNCFARFWDLPPAKISANDKYSCAIVLGGFVNADENGAGYFNSSSDRFIQALRLYKMGTVSSIMVTGGTSDPSVKFRYSDWVAKELKQFGVSENSIFFESGSRNTFENAVAAAAILDTANLKPPYVLVTSAYHMRRSLWVFRKKGIPVVACPSNYIAGRGEFSLRELLPSSGVLSTWPIYIKEVIGVGAYKLKFAIKGDK
jgi:uncharacterized SAM-binding protein YcdF (DUF218 family)